MKGLKNEFKWLFFLVVLISGLIVWTYFVSHQVRILITKYNCD